MKTSNKLLVQNADSKLFLGYSAYQPNPISFQIENVTNLYIEPIVNGNDNVADFGKWSEKDFKKDQSGYDVGDVESIVYSNQEKFESDDDVIY